MDGAALGLFLLATFLGGMTTGVAGFAMGLVVSGIWLHILTPVQTASLIVGYGLLVQGYGVWKLRHAFDWRKVTPFVAGGAVGVPIGVWLLAHLNPAYLRHAVGALLVVYSLHGMARPAPRPFQAGVTTDAGVGFLNGLLGGLTGLAGVLVAIWCQLQGWPKDVQRAIFQPVIFFAFAMSAAWLAISGAVTADVVKLFFIGLPAVLVGIWFGMTLYGRLDEAGFRTVILVLLLLSGIVLVVPASIFK